MLVEAEEELTTFLEDQVEAEELVMERLTEVQVEMVLIIEDQALEVEDIRTMVMVAKVAQELL
jgi:hypothetical protein